MKKVYLGGDDIESEWRERLIPLLQIDYYDPTVDSWTTEGQAESRREQEECDFSLFVVTPKMQCIYTIAEVVHSSIARQSESTILCVLDGDDDRKFGASQVVAFAAVGRLIDRYGTKVFNSLEKVAEHLNGFYTKIEFSPNTIECTIERDGPTQMNLGKASYMFEENADGCYVCEVLSVPHRKHLLAMPDFHVYKEEDAPKTEFTAEEEVFLRKWRILNADDFLAYANGHVEEIKASSDAVRDVAIKKWRKLLPHMKICPFCPLDPKVKGQKQPEPMPEAELVEMRVMSRDATAFETKFYESWRLLDAKHFKKVVEEKEQQFLDLPLHLWNTAKAKWNRLVTDRTGDAWPFEEV